MMHFEVEFVEDDDEDVNMNENNNNPGSVNVAAVGEIARSSHDAAGGNEESTGDAAAVAEF